MKISWIGAFRIVWILNGVQMVFMVGSEISAILTAGNPVKRFYQKKCHEVFCGSKRVGSGLISGDQS
jgi:hypothetical protein